MFLLDSLSLGPPNAHAPARAIFLLSFIFFFISQHTRFIQDKQTLVRPRGKLDTCIIYKYISDYIHIHGDTTYVDVREGKEGREGQRRPGTHGNYGVLVQLTTSGRVVVVSDPAQEFEYGAYVCTFESPRYRPLNRINGPFPMSKKKNCVPSWPTDTSCFFPFSK